MKSEKWSAFELTCKLFLLLFAAASLFPFLMLVSSSITDESALVMEGFKLWPSKISFDAYQLIFKTNTVSQAYKVTIFVTAVGTALSLLATSAIAYALSIKTFMLRNTIAMYVYFTMLFSGGLVPTYLLISKYLHMSDTLWVLIIPALVSPWNMFLMRNFFQDIPSSLMESAKIDGAGDIKILLRIVLPISKPAIATIGLFYALGYWNEWYRAMLFINKESLYPLQYLIMSIMRNIDYANSMASQTTIDFPIPTYTVRMATTVVTIGPIIFLYPFLQKYFVKGLTVGAIKG